MIFNFGIFLPSALYPVVQVDKLHATNGWIGAIATVNGLIGVLCSPIAARAATRFGNRAVLGASGLAFTAIPIGASLVPTVQTYIVVAAAMGGLGVAVNIALFQCLLEVAPLDRQTHYTAMYTMMVNGAVASGPLLGTLLLGFAGYVPAFGLAAALVFAGSMCFIASDPGRLARAPTG